MKILHLAGVWHHAPSGGASLVTDLACGLKERHGIDAVIAGAVRGNPAFSAQLAATGIATIDLNVPSFRSSPFEAVKAFNSLRNHPAVKEADLLHAHAHIIVPALLARSAGKKLVLTSHGITTRPPGRLGISSRFYRWLYGRAGQVVAVSNHVKSDTLGTFVKTGLKVEVIHNGCRTDRFAPGEPGTTHHLLNRLHREGRVICAMAGRLDPDKRPFRLLELAEATRGALPRLAFVLIGTGSLEAEIRQAIIERDLAERVFLLGWQPSIVDCYRQIDILLHLNETEGFGLIFIEAMASELPVVGADGSAVREIVRPGETGFICKLGDWEEWAVALRKLHDPGLRRRLGQAGRQRVRKHFSVEAMCDKYATVYRRLLA